MIPLPFKVENRNGQIDFRVFFCLSKFCQWYSNGGSGTTTVPASTTHVQLGAVVVLVGRQVNDDIHT